MKINRPDIINLIHKVYKREQVHGKAGQAEKPDTLSQDRLEISTGSEILKKEFSRLAGSDASRLARIEELACQVEAGEYKVDSRKLAEAMFKYMEAENDGHKDG